MLRGLAAIAFLSCQLAEAVVVQLEADLRPEFVVAASGESPAGVSTASGRGFFSLDLTPGAPTMSYTIEIEGLSFIDDITAVHLHFGHDPSIISVSSRGPQPRHVGADGPTGPHLLNIFGLPREDDADLVVDAANGRISGVWDNGDENFGPDGERGPGDSVALFEGIDLLLENEVYVQIHTMAFPDGELRGQLRVVPEPRVVILAAIGVVGGVLRRRR